MATAWVVLVSSRSAKVAPSDTASCVSRVAGVSSRGKKTSLSAPSFSVYQTLLAPARAVPKPSLSPGDQVDACPGAPGAWEPVAAETGTAPTPANVPRSAPAASQVVAARRR